MEFVICDACGYLTENMGTVPHCVNCLAEGTLKPYGDPGEREAQVRKSVIEYVWKPDALTNEGFPIEKTDSRFRAVTRRMLTAIKGGEMSEDEALKPAADEIEKWVDYAVGRFKAEPAPIGGCNEEMNSALSRHLRKTIQEFQG